MQSATNRDGADSLLRLCPSSLRDSLGVGLLRSLLAHSHPVPERLDQGVQLFHVGDRPRVWYLVLSGEVLLYVPAHSHTQHPASSSSCAPATAQEVRVVRAGTLFGELSHTHSCSAIVRRTVEIVRLPHQHFLHVYRKHGDQLQRHICIGQDELETSVLNRQQSVMLPPYCSTTSVTPPSLDGDEHEAGATEGVGGGGEEGDGDQLLIGAARMPVDRGAEVSVYCNHHHYHPHHPATASASRHHSASNGNGLSESGTTPTRRGGGKPSSMTATGNSTPVHLFDMHAEQALSSRLRLVAGMLCREMHTTSAHLLRDRVLRGGRLQTGCCSGSELVDWLLVLAGEQLSRLQARGAWQLLLEQHLLHHVTGEAQFVDSAQIFYRWADNLLDSADDPLLGLIDDDLPESPSDEDWQQEGTTARTDPLSSGLFLLRTLGPDALFRMITQKCAEERSPQELELVYEELLHVKALAHLSTMVKRELAAVVRFQHIHCAGSVLFHQGEPGLSWWIVLRGTVSVHVRGKGEVCRLAEGDDVGKLALLTDAPRAATVKLCSPYGHFLVVDKFHFNRILRDVEANTVRLKEHGRDVLVLERVNRPAPQPDASSTSAPPPAPLQQSYSVMAGTPEKILEYILETRMDTVCPDPEQGFVSSSDTTDTLLTDFVLTYSVFMRTNDLCNQLKTYCNRREKTATAQRDDRTGELDAESGPEGRLSAQRRVVEFVCVWMQLLDDAFFLDHAASAFIDELHCAVLEELADARSSERQPLSPSLLHSIHLRVLHMRSLRERAQRLLSRRSLVALHCGVYSAEAPAPYSLLPVDVCHVQFYLIDDTCITMPVRMDTTVRQICQQAIARVRYAPPDVPFRLIELKSNGDRSQLADDDVSVGTQQALNSRYILLYEHELNEPQPMRHQSGPTVSQHAALLDALAGSQLAALLHNFHLKLLSAVREGELLAHVFGRAAFPGRLPSNLDLLLRRFNELHYWTSTEILLASSPTRRLQLIRKFIKTALHARGRRDLLSLFAITLGLNNVAVARLQHVWQKVPRKLRSQLTECEALLDPARNHRAYRMLVANLQSPIVPFVPLLLKDLTFVHEGNKSHYSGLVNFEKMHVIADQLRSFRRYRAVDAGFVLSERNGTKSANGLDTVAGSWIRSLSVIDNQERLMQLSYAIEPATSLSVPSSSTLAAHVPPPIPPHRSLPPTAQFVAAVGARRKLPHPNQVALPPPPPHPAC